MELLLAWIFIFGLKDGAAVAWISTVGLKDGAAEVPERFTALLKCLLQQPRHLGH